MRKIARVNGPLMLKPYTLFFFCSQQSLPLHLASSSGHAGVVSLLLSKVSHQLDTKDVNGRTAFHISAANGHLNVLTLLLAQGAPVDTEDEVCTTRHDHKGVNLDLEPLFCGH